MRTCTEYSWAQVAHLALAEKGFSEDEHDLKNVDLIAGANFDAEYLKVNPNGTIPSISSASLDKPIIESTDIIRYIDGRGGNSTLVPSDPAVKSKAQAIKDLVHSANARTGIIYFASVFNDFLVNRQKRLGKEHAANPDHPFYGPKIFYKHSDDTYKTLAREVNKLDSLLVLPYAAGDAPTEADFHVAACVSHAMRAAGSDSSQIQNFDVLEKCIQKSDPAFTIGKKA
ncbi:hypothetical protein V8C37DRAFT_409372 [Trichoderma ceciliae]